MGACVPNGFLDESMRCRLEDGGVEIRFWGADPAEVVGECVTQRVDVLLLGSGRPDSETLASVGEVVAATESTRVVLICKRSGNGDVRKALDAGARALIPLNDVADALLPVVEVVRAGQVSVPGTGRHEAGRKVLTAREKQILGQVVLGMTNAEIAAKLYLAESTIKSHLSSAFGKLGVASRNEAAALILNPSTGVGLGILTIPSEKVSTSR